MDKEIIKKRIEKEGLVFTVCYYFCKTISKVNEIIACKLLKPFFHFDEKLIVLKNRQGQDYTDNARAFFDFLIANNYNKEYKIVWLASSKKPFKNMNIDNVRIAMADCRNGYNSLKAYLYANNARFFFYTNNTADLNRFSKSQQTIVNLWHGCGYKGTTRGSSNMKSTNSMERFDYALVPGDIFVKTKAAYWDCDEKKIIPIGYPRYDWILDKTITKAEVLQKLYNVKKSMKLVLWLPTFRKTDSVVSFAEDKIDFKYGIPLVEDVSMLEELDRYCRKNNILLIIKRHPMQEKFKLDRRFGNVKLLEDRYLAKKDVILYHLLGVCDALISDYSSAAVDYMLLDKPIAYAIPDIEEYKEARGFVFENPLDYMPGPHIKSFDGLMKFFEDFVAGRDEYAEMRRCLMPVMHNKAENYCSRLVEFLNI